MKLLKWTLVGLGGLAAAIAILAAWGTMLPLSNAGSRSIEIARPPEHVWAVMHDAARAPRWQPMLASAKRLSPTLIEMTYTDGIVARAETKVSEPPRRLVERIVPDPNVPFRGGWTAELTPTPSGTRVTFHSDIEIDQPLIRWAQRYVFTLEKSLDEMLAGLKRESEI